MAKNKINNGETARTELLDELESERTIWMNAQDPAEAQEAYNRLDDLLLLYASHLLMKSAVEGEYVAQAA